MVQFAPAFKEIYDSPDPRLNTLSLEAIRAMIYKNVLLKGGSQNAPQRRALPNGGGNPPGNPRGNDDAFDPIETDYDDIIKSAMRELPRQEM